jgi:hypothetical protein
LQQTANATNGSQQVQLTSLLPSDLQLRQLHRSCCSRQRLALLYSKHAKPSQQALQVSQQFTNTRLAVAVTAAAAAAWARRVNYKCLNRPQIGDALIKGPLTRPENKGLFFTRCAASADAACVLQELRVQ